MESELSKQIAAVRASAELGCFGAHRLPTGEWMPCSSTKQFLILTNEIKSRMSLDDVQKWSSARKAKGKKRKKRWEKLRERRILGIDTLEGGGLVSGNSRTSANAISGGSIPPMTYGNTAPPNMSTKSIKPAYMPRDNDPDVFIDIESARKRSRQLGCIGVSRRMSKGGKTVWMPCTNISDYNNLTGMTALGRLNQRKKRNTVVRTVIREELKRRKKSIPEELLGKSLGRKLRNTSRFVSARFDPNAFDGDGDGLVQEGTPFERPAIPGVPKAPSNQPKTQDREFDNSEISAIRKWMSSMSPSEIDDFRAEPIGAYDSPENVSGLASRTGTTVAGQRRGPQRMTKPQKSVTIDGLNNPEASPTNPFRNLGGRAMGKIIRSMVKSKNDGSEQRVTYIIGGNTGSGKSTVFDGHLVPKGLVPSSEEAAVIDPDFIKKGLVGYNDGAGAGAVHRESQVVTDKVISDSASDNLNMVIMGAGARRQIQHMREARSRGESVRGHWVHVPQKVASQRIRKRTEETGRYIPDNTSHMAATLPRVISSAFEEDLLDEFYLWDNDIPEGSSPKLIAKKVRGEDFEVFDSKKFEEFAGGKKWADRWVQSSEKNDVSIPGLSSSSSKKKKGGRYTPPKNQPNESGLPGQQTGRVGTASPFGQAPGTGAQTSILGDAEVEKILEQRLQDFVKQVKRRVTHTRRGRPKDSAEYLRDKLKTMSDAVQYMDEAQVGPFLLPLDISRLSLKGKLDTPNAIKNIVARYVPTREPGESDLDFAERIYQTIPSMSFTGVSRWSNSRKTILDILQTIGNDDAQQLKVRKILEEELTQNEAFRTMVEQFGLPFIVGGTNQFNGQPLGAISAFHAPMVGVLVLGKEQVDSGGSEAIGSTMFSRRFDTIQQTIRHEWFHYLDAILLASDNDSLKKRIEDYRRSISNVVSNTEDVVKRVFGKTNKELVRKFESRLLQAYSAEYQRQFPGSSDEQARREALKLIKRIFQDEKLNRSTQWIEQMIDSFMFQDSDIQDLFKDRGGIYDDIAKKYSEYARYGMHELIAEIGKMITSTGAERARPDSNIYAIDSSTVDFLVKMMPSVDRTMWLSIIRMSFPGIKIKQLRNNDYL
jgi:predicted ABC-type ATPase